MSVEAARASQETTIIGDSPAIRRSVALARQFAPSLIPILLTGPTGSGKELFAREIHRWSGRDGPFVDVNCGALPRELVEGELFGHRRGAYTGATGDSPGLIAEANRGTLFLDEMSSLPLDGQVKLLRSLETREVRRVGDTVNRKIDFRLVAAVQGDLAPELREGRFRIDLYQRVAGVVIDLPPLALRREDVIPLTRHFAFLHRRMVSPEAERVLVGHHWEGNVRELRSVIDRAVMLCPDPHLDAGAMEEAIRLGASSLVNGAASPSRRPRIDLPSLREVGRRNNWDRLRMARDLGVSVATLYRRLRAYRISLTSLSGVHSHSQPDGEND